LRLIAACVLGVLSVGGFAPFGLFPLPFVTLAILFVWWQEADRPARAAALGYAFGLGFFLAGVSWVWVSMHRYGGMPAAAAALATVLFCAWLALFPALAGWLFARLRGGRALLDVPLAAALWSFAESLRGLLLTGFPWLEMGYSQSPPSPLAGYAPVSGVHGVSFAMLLVAGCLGVAWRERTARMPAAVAILSLGALGAGLGAVGWTRPEGAEFTVSLLQGNIEQSLKWQPERFRDSLDRYLELARANPARLVVLPETAIPAVLDQLPEGYLARLAQAAGGDVLLGTVVRERGRTFNSAVGLSAAALQRYDKSHLVPFGEFTPPFFAWTLGLLRIPMSDFSAGAPRQAPLALAGQRIAPDICYEDIFGTGIRRALPEAGLLVNLSNTAWFGDSLAQAQHLQIARMRALEAGRFMLRATNTGMTAVVTPRGEVAAALPPFTAGALRSRVRAYAGATPYVRWGDAPAHALAGLAVLAAILGRALRFQRKL